MSRDPRPSYGWVYVLVEHDGDEGTTNMGAYSSRMKAEEAMAQLEALNEASGEDVGTPLTYSIDPISLL